MENMIGNSWESNDNNKLQFDASCIKHFSETRKWAMFLSIMGFVFTGLCIVTVTVMLTMPSAMGHRSVSSFIPLLLIVTIYFFPLYYLIRFSIYSKRALNSMDQNALVSSFRYLKNFYRFIGIMITVVVGLYVLSGAIIGLSAAFMKH